MGFCSNLCALSLHKARQIQVKSRDGAAVLQQAGISSTRLLNSGLAGLEFNTAVNPQGRESCLLVAAGVQFLRVAKLPRLIRDDGMCSRGLVIFFVPCEKAERRVGQFA